MQFKKIKITLAIGAAIVLAACSSNQDQVTSFVHANEQELYNGAKVFIQSNDYKDADSYLTQFQLQYPFSTNTIKARILSVYVNYKLSDPTKTLAAVDRFLKNNANQQYIDYALYVRALATIKQNTNSLYSVFNLDNYKRNISEYRGALNNLYTLRNYFPNSSYTAQVKILITYLEDILAEYEIYVTSYHIKNNNPLAAISRAQVTISNFPNSYYSKLGYEQLVQAYKMLDLKEDEVKAQIAVKALSNFTKPVIQAPNFTDIGLPFPLN